MTDSEKLDKLIETVSQMQERFDKMDNRFDKMDNRFNILELKQDRTAKKLDDLRLDVAVAERDIRRDILVYRIISKCLYEHFPNADKASIFKREYGQLLNL